MKRFASSCFLLCLVISGVLAPSCIPVAGYKPDYQNKPFNVILIGDSLSGFDIKNDTINICYHKSIDDFQGINGRISLHIVNDTLLVKMYKYKDDRFRIFVEKGDIRKGQDIDFYELQTSELSNKISCRISPDSVDRLNARIRKIKDYKMHKMHRNSDAYLLYWSNGKRSVRFYDPSHKLVLYDLIKK